MIKRFIFILFIICISGSFAFLQTTGKDKLIARKKKLEKEIELTDKLLTDTRKKKENSIHELNLVKAKIRKRNRLIAQYNTDIASIERTINDKTQKLISYKSDLEKTKKEYAALIYYAFKNKNQQLDLMFILASEDINQLYSRYKYLQQYKEYRLKNIKLIERLKMLIEIEIIELGNRKVERKELLNSVLTEKSVLVQDRGQVNTIVKALNGEESNLEKELNEKRKLADKIDKEIEKFIKKETKKNSYRNLTPEERLISDDFVSNRGRLPWPTQQGIITDRFGEHPHPVIRDLLIRNNGIDITTVPGTEARAVFGGVVSKVFSIKGANSTIIIRHGNFYTVYHNLENVKVRAGDKVDVKQLIGHVYTDTKANKTLLHFEVWKEMEKQNPEDWLSN